MTDSAAPRPLRTNFPSTGTSVDYELVKRNAWVRDGILVVSIDDKRIPWEWRELLGMVGVKLYGERVSRS